MSRYLIGCAFAGVVAFTAAVAAQDPPRTPPQTPTPGTSASQQSAKTVTVEGCLMREADVPGRKPNVAERAGMGEDYILTSTKMVKGTAPTASTPSKTEDKPTGTAGIRAMMYEVAGIEGDKLKEHAGQRVQIDGTFENVDRAKGTGQTASDELVELRGTTIRKVAGECPAKQ
jgi:hypothetical protein